AETRPHRRPGRPAARRPRHPARRGPARLPRPPACHDPGLPGRRRHGCRGAAARPHHGEVSRPAGGGQQPPRRLGRDRLHRARPQQAGRLHDRLHQHADHRHHPARAAAGALPARRLRPDPQHRRRSRRHLGAARQPAARRRRAGGGGPAPPRPDQLRHLRHRLRRPSRGPRPGARHRHQIPARPLRRRRPGPHRHAGPADRPCGDEYRRGDRRFPPGPAPPARPDGHRALAGDGRRADLPRAGLRRGRGLDARPRRAGRPAPPGARPAGGCRPPRRGGPGMGRHRHPARPAAPPARPGRVSRRAGGDAGAVREALGRPSLEGM
ncbi:MAG: Tricarboxylate transport protein TctC, partial [uncultured Craurococcus sp.]